APEGVYTVPHDLVARVGDGVVAGARLAAGLLDLVDDRVGHPAAGAAAAVARDAGVVDDDLGACAREGERMGATEAAAGAGHDRDFSFEQFHRSLTAVR